MQLGKQKPLQVSTCEGLCNHWKGWVRACQGNRGWPCQVLTAQRSLICTLLQDLPAYAGFSYFFILRWVPIFGRSNSGLYGSQGREYISWLLPSDCREYRERQWAVDTRPFDTQLWGYELFPWGWWAEKKKATLFYWALLFVLSKVQTVGLFPYVVIEHWTCFFKLNMYLLASLVNSDLHL